MPPQSQMMEQNSNLLPPDANSIPESQDSGSESQKKIKCVLVGDGAVGKTSLVVSYTTNGYPTEYTPTAFDNYAVVVTVDNSPVRVQLCDTAGQDDFDSLRPLCYPDTDAFLLCFSVVTPTSFHNVTEKWVPEIRKHCPKVPIILVGTQSDLRNDVKVLIELAHYQEVPVPESEALALAQEIGAVAYMECSSLTQSCLKEVFDTALLAAMKFMGPMKRTKSTRRSSKKHKKLETNPLPKKSEQSYAKKAGWKRFCCLV